MQLNIFVLKCIKIRSITFKSADEEKEDKSERILKDRAKLLRIIL